MDINTVIGNINALVAESVQAAQAPLIADVTRLNALIVSRDAVIAARDATIIQIQKDFDAYKLSHPDAPAGDTTPPSAPTNLVAAVVSTSAINLTWSASTDSVGVVGYDVYRNGTLIGSRVGTSYADSGLTASTTYSYSVRAKDAAGNVSTNSTTVSATTQAVTPPTTATWPKASTTGVKAGVARTAYTGPSIISTAGTVVSNKNITGTISVTVDGVKFQNCFFSNFSNYGVIGENKSVIIEDCTFDGRGSSRTKAIAAKAPTVRRCNIYGMVIAIDIWGGPATIEDNYIHDLAEASTNPDNRHFDGIALLGGGNAVIKHNTIDVSDGTACTFLSSQQGAINNVLVENNLLMGQASYTAYAEKSSSAMTNVRYINNYIERGIFGYILNNSNSVEQGNVQWQEGVNPTPAAVTAWKNN